MKLMACNGFLHFAQYAFLHDLTAGPCRGSTSLRSAHLRALQKSA